MGLTTALAWVATALIGSGAAAQTPPVKSAAAGDAALTLPLEGVNTNPDWLAKPTSDDLQREFPVLAQWLRIKGRALVQCTAEPDGRVDKCRVISESPSGLGFGSAAVRSSKYFMMKPATLDGVPISSPVNVPLRFDRDVASPPERTTEATAKPSPAALALARRVVDLANSKSLRQAAIERQLGPLMEGVATAAHPQDALFAIDALRQGMMETLDEEAERSAARQAATLGEAQLAQVVAFLESPAGRAWNAASAASSTIDQASFWLRASARARERFCAKVACGEDAPTPSAAAPPRPSRAGG